MFKFKNLIFWLVGIVSLFGFIACGNNSIKYEDIKRNSFKIEKINYNQYKISWNEVKGALFYEIKYHKMKYNQFLYREEDYIYEIVETTNIILNDLDLDSTYYFSIRASTSKNWIEFNFKTKSEEDIPFLDENQNRFITRPTLTLIPTETTKDYVEIEINGEIGTKIILNNRDTGQIIGSNGKTKILLDTSLDDSMAFSILTFYIYLEDEGGNKSDTLYFTIIRHR